MSFTLRGLGSLRGSSWVLVFGALGALAGCKKKPRAITWAANANAYNSPIDTVLAFSCPPGGRPGLVWGTDTYTSDSSICGAALHSGRIQSESGGVVRIRIGPGLPSYSGSVRAGVATLNFGPYPRSFTIEGGPAPGLVAVPVPGVQFNSNGLNIGGLQINVGRPNPNAPPVGDPWVANASNRRGQLGTSFVHNCPPGGAPRTVWGSGPYTDDSSICTAAVHAGRINQATGGPVTVFIHPGRPRYQGTSANGISSSNFGAYAGSFSFDPTLPPETTAPAGMQGLDWDDNAQAFRGQNGTIHRVWCPPGGSVHTVWGSGPYTDDSSVCNAAVHAGRIRPETGGTFGVLTSQGFKRYRGSSRNGITSLNFGQYPGSFVVIP
jgi:hypothetical protein